MIPGRVSVRLPVSTACTCLSLCISITAPFPVALASLPRSSEAKCVSGASVCVRGIRVPDPRSSSLKAGRRLRQISHSPSHAHRRRSHLLSSPGLLHLSPPSPILVVGHPLVARHTTHTHTRRLTSRLTMSAAASAVQGPGSLLSLLSSLRMSRQTEAALMSQLAGSAWTAVMSGRIMPVMMPLLSSFLIMPLLAVIKTVAKSVTFFGITIWLFASVVPVFLSLLGITGAGAFVGRALHTTSFPYADLDFAGAYHNLTSAGLRHLDLDSNSCRALMSCRAGEFVLENYPFVVAMLRNSGVGDVMSSYTKKAGDRYAGRAWSVLMGGRNETCAEELMDACPGFLRFEALFDSTARAAFHNSTTPAVTSTTTEMPEAVGGDLVVKALKSLARANNGSFPFLSLLA